MVEWVEIQGVNKLSQPGAVSAVIAGSVVGTEHVERRITPCKLSVSLRAISKCESKLHDIKSVTCKVGSIFSYSGAYHGQKPEAKRSILEMEEDLMKRSGRVSGF